MDEAKSVNNRTLYGTRESVVTGVNSSPHLERINNIAFSILFSEKMLPSQPAIKRNKLPTESPTEVTSKTGRQKHQAPAKPNFCKPIPPGLTVEEAFKSVCEGGSMIMHCNALEAEDRDKLVARLVTKDNEGNYPFLKLQESDWGACFFSWEFNLPDYKTDIKDKQDFFNQVCKEVVCRQDLQSSTLHSLLNCIVKYDLKIHNKEFIGYLLDMWGKPSKFDRSYEEFQKFLNKYSDLLPTHPKLRSKL